MTSGHERLYVAALLLSLSAASLTATVHYVRLSAGRMSRMPDEESRSDLFNHRLMALVSLLATVVSVTALVACVSMFGR